MADTIREAQEKLANMIAQDPAKARVKNSPATASLQHGLKIRVAGPRGEAIDTDMPAAVGGAGSAANPGWLLRAGLASCTATVIAMRAAKLGIALDTLEVSVESESDNRGMLGLDDAVSAGLGGLRTHVRIGAAGVDGAQLHEIVRWADSHSPVACTLREAGEGKLDVEVV
jgi:uncharacterized OsmC-like protein